MKDFFLVPVFYVLLAALLLMPMVGQVRAADPVYIDAFAYQVQTIEQAYALQQALCSHFRYEPMIYDPVYVAECAAYYGPDQTQPTVYPELIMGDNFCENPPVIENPEICPDYANRKMVDWFNMVIEKNDTALWERIQTYTETEKVAAKAARGTTKIKQNK